ncbi:hypothetical protein BGZ67_008148 [Mortierella alpina]|nr:hypothetical protein BGZ67_008148 [Mortierella alpina]
MLKEGYISQVKAHHYMPVIFEATHRDEDPDPDGCKEIVAIEGMVQFLCQSMEVDVDFMALMPSGRQEVALFYDFKDLVRQSGILRKGQKVLVTSLILSSTARIIEECVTLEDVRVLSIVEQDPQFLSFVIQSLIEDLAWIKEPSSTPGVSLSDVLDIGRIESSLRILERLAMVSSKPAAALANNNNNRIFSLLVHLITLCRMHAFQYPHQTESLNIMLHVLRLLINVTNGNEPCCEGLSQGGSIPALVQNFVQFYGRSRNYRPGESLLEQRQQELPTEARLQGTDSRRRRGQRGERTGEPSSTNLKRSSSNHPASQEEEDALSSADSGSEGDYQDDEITIDNNADGWYDLLLVSLGLLINMLESAPLRRKQLTETAIGLDCKAVGDCFHKECRCDKSMEALERLTENQMLAAYLALLLCCAVGGNADDEARLYKSVHGQSLASMLELLKGFVALHEAIQLDSPDQQQSSQELLKSSPCLSTKRSLALSDSFIPPTLDSDSEANDDRQAAEIVFVNSAKRAAETQASFLKIIHLLEDMESRQVSRSK